MVRITIDEELKRKLIAAGEVVELCDTTGEVLARFVPHVTEPINVSADFPELAPEEIERRCHDQRVGLSTEQVKQRLHDLESR